VTVSGAKRWRRRKTRATPRWGNAASMPSERKTKNHTTREQQTGTAISDQRSATHWNTVRLPRHRWLQKGSLKKSATPAPDASACWMRVSSSSENPTAIRRHFGAHAIHTRLAADRHPHHRPLAGKRRQTSPGKTVTRQDTDRELPGFPHPVTHGAQRQYGV